MAKTSELVSTLDTCIPLPLTDMAELSEIIIKGKDWALMHGAGIRPKATYDEDTMQFVPFLLTPTSFPRKEFENAIALQPILNELMHNVSNDTEFLRTSLESTIKTDIFTRKLFNIYETMEKDGASQTTNLTLGILRSDYLLHMLSNNMIKQVEINTVASSFGGISTKMKLFHSYILSELGHADKLVNLPANNALSEISGAILEAWRIQGKENAVILFIVENITYNICDQRFHEFEIRRLNPKVKILRKTLTEIYEQGKLGPNNELYIQDYEVTVIYFRAGYVPEHYPTENEWNARLLMEQSLAIKCPSIQYHLAGTKKVQQALAKPGVLERFLNDKEKIKAVSQIFTGLYSLDEADNCDEIIKIAMESPERFVMKPQLEGGGNNLYDTDIRDALQKMNKDERSTWILMDRIVPPTSKAYVIRPGNKIPPEIVDVVSELGIFGAVIGDKNKIYYNRNAGHMLRTKYATVNETGVAAGFGALDSPYLIDD